MQVSIFLILLFKLLTHFPFVSFLSISILTLLPFSTLSLLPYHIYPGLSCIPSNHSPFCHTHYFTLDQYFTSLFGPDRLPSHSAGDQYFTAAVLCSLFQSSLLSLFTIPFSLPSILCPPKIDFILFHQWHIFFAFCFTIFLIM